LHGSVGGFKDFAGYPRGSQNGLKKHARICRVHNELQNLIECLILFVTENQDKNGDSEEPKKSEDYNSAINSVQSRGISAACLCAMILPYSEKEISHQNI